MNTGRSRIDFSPEQLDDQATRTAPDLDQVLQLPDPATEPEPSEIELLQDEKLAEIESDTGVPIEAADAGVLESVTWPRYDLNSPDYAHVAQVSVPSTFKLTRDVIEKLIEANGFSVYRDKNVVAFALRGARIVAGNEVEGADSIELEELRPDHTNFRCVLGFYFPNTKKLNAYVGSTVPCRLALYSYSQGGDAANLLPNGLYTYYVWRHTSITPALRLASSNASNSTLETGAQATVLRSTNDAVLGTKDTWDLSRPLDNVHCSYFLMQNARHGACFSSWGCLTVRGKKTSTDQWKKFQSVLSSVRDTSRVDLILLTGKDAAIAARFHGGHPELAGALVRLRQGSHGPAVERLQAKLNVEATGFFGPATRKALTELQHEVNEFHGLGKTADGIYSPEFDQRVGWNIFEPLIS